MSFAYYIALLVCLIKTYLGTKIFREYENGSAAEIGVYGMDVDKSTVCESKNFRLRLNCLPAK